jgi:glycosyltransferase involved in cell wall biosynthesis
MHGETGHLFHISRVWSSHHGGSFYSRALVDEMLKRGWKVTLLAEQFADGQAFPERVHLSAFFRRGIRSSPRRATEILKIWKLVANTPRALVIVQGDLPRVTYLFLQLWVPLIFIRQDGILTCPGNNRFLERSRSVCRKPFGLSCLSLHRKEDCMGRLSFLQQAGRLAFRARDCLLLRGFRNFVANSLYIARLHHKPERVLYPPRLSCSEHILFSKRDLRRLVFCGRLEEVKGAGEAIRILSLLPDEFHLEIFGEGPERGRLGKRVEDLKLGQRVRFHGWVDPMTRDRGLASAGALLMPSLWDEAFGMAGIEALAQGTPVVAYDVGGVSEWCRGGVGVLVSCGDVRRAAAAVRQLTNDPERWMVHSRAAQRLVALEFPAERFARQLDGVLPRSS